MIQPVTKLIQIAPVSPQKAAQFDLTSVDGRMQIAEQLQADIDAWCQQAFDDGPRSHLGASLIGAECDRHIWYSWRWFKHKVFSGRMLRLFQDGHWYEDRLIEMLRGIGCTVTQVSEDGQQIRIFAVEGHFGGSSDGSGTLPPSYRIPDRFLLEFKTANEKQFNKFHDIEHSKPQHWGQTCVYGVKLGLEYVIYILVGKNDSDMKIQIEPLDWSFGQQLINKSDWIIHSQVPPAKLSMNVSDYRCKFCDHYNVCQLDQTPDVNCRSCMYSQPIENNQWRCNKWCILIPSKEAMLEGCQAYELLRT